MSSKYFAPIYPYKYNQQAFSLIGWIMNKWHIPQSYDNLTSAWWLHHNCLICLMTSRSLLTTTEYWLITDYLTNASSSTLMSIKSWFPLNWQTRQTIKGLWSFPQPIKLGLLLLIKKLKFQNHTSFFSTRTSAVRKSEKLSALYWILVDQL